jgi:hypothetical protein
VALISPLLTYCGVNIGYLAASCRSFLCDLLSFWILSWLASRSRGRAVDRPMRLLITVRLSEVSGREAFIGQLKWALSSEKKQMNNSDF